MNKSRLSQQLLALVDDDVLDDQEKRQLRQQIHEWNFDELAFLRNQFFKLARQRLGEGAVDQTRIVSWLERCVKQIDLELKPTGQPSQSFFSPGSACQQAIIRALSQAHTAVDICVFTISDNDIAEQILTCHRRGVTVRLLTDNDKCNDLGSDVERLSRMGVPTRMDRSDAHMHHKFCIIDGRLLINGSFNWTRSASERNQENIAFIYEAALITQYSHQFEQLWQQFA